MVLAWLIWIPVSDLAFLVVYGLWVVLAFPVLLFGAVSSSDAARRMNQRTEHVFRTVETAHGYSQRAPLKRLSSLLRLDDEFVC